MKQEQHAGPQIRTVRDRSLSRAVLATKREVLLARVCLYLLEKYVSTDKDQEFIGLYNELKPLAERVARDGKS